MIVINAKNRILGRVCSQVAEKLMKSKEKVYVVNSRSVIISGRKKVIFEKYKARRRKRGKGDPRKNIKFPKYPDNIFKRSIRGMLPRKAKGKKALERLKVYIDVPEFLKEKVEKEKKLPNILHITLEDLSKHLGAKLNK